MVKTLLLAFTLVLSAAWMHAQTSSSQTGSSTQAGTSTSSSSGQTKVQGCLDGSNGNFTLKSDSGTTYQLQGDTSKLSKHVGHEVEITGTTSNASSASTPSSGSSASGASSSTTGGQESLSVDKVKHIAETCSNTNK